MLKLAIVLIVSGIFIVTVTNFVTPAPFQYRGYFLAFALYALLFIIMGSPYDIFKIGIYEKRNLQISYIISMTLVNVISYIVLALISRAIINPVPILVMSVIQYVVGFLFFEMADNIYHRLYPSRDTVIIYANTEWDMNVAQKFAQRDKRYDIRSVVRADEGFDKIKEEIDKYSTVVIGALDLNLREDVFNYAYENRKRTFVMPTINDIIMRSSHVTQIGDSILHLIKNRTLSLEQLIIKRIFDIVFSALFLLLTLPITLIVALLIKLHDGGPIFFKQKRLTRNREPFDIIKFRSMVVDAEKDGAQFTTENDDRITPIGKFIRATRIDEIPQFINVLKGEMSIVGPRAERVENYDLYTELMPEFYYRTMVKAGVTGYAQIYGRYNTSHEDKARMDVYYIQNFSILNDFRLILATVKVVFTPESTEGFDSSFFETDEDHSNGDD